MRTKLLIISALCFISSMSYAQQNKMLTHFIFDKMSVNPGATGVGMSNTVCATTIYRNQWDRVNGAPTSALLNLEGELSRFLPGGVGLSFYHDAIGFARQNNVVLNYSYHFPLPNGTLGVGAGLGLVSYGMNPNWVTPDGNPEDPQLPQGVTEANFDANFGVYYLDNAGWYAGLSTTHIPASELEQLNFNTARHYYAMGGYLYKSAFDVTNLDLDFNAMLRTELVKYSGELNVRAIWQDLFWAGATYRVEDAIGIMAGVQFSSFRIGYSYDITTNALQTISRGSHEILLKYCYPIPPPPVTISRNPRYL